MNVEAPPTQTLQTFNLQDMRDGVRSMDLSAVEGRLFDEKKVVELEEPFVRFYKAGKMTSTLRAPKGRIYTDSHAMEAWGGVYLLTTDSTTLKTEQLRYDPAQRVVTSTAAVHIEKPDSITDGVGLRADPELSSVKIGHQRVRITKRP